MSSTCWCRTEPVSRWVARAVASISPKEGRTALAMDVEEVHLAIKEWGTLVMMGETALLTLTMRQARWLRMERRLDNWVLFAVERLLERDVCFDGVEENV